MKKADICPGKEKVMRTVIYAYNYLSEQYLEALRSYKERGFFCIYSYQIKQNNCKKELTGQGQ